MLIKSRQTLLLLFLCYFFSFAGISQPLKKKISLEDLWQKGTFHPKTLRGLNWMKNGEFYSAQVIERDGGQSNILRYSIKTGEVIDTIIKGREIKDPNSLASITIESYEFSSDEKKILISTGAEQIYRRSSKSDYYVVDLNTKEVICISEKGKLMYAEFSQQGDKIAFVRENNVYIFDLTQKAETAVSTTGELNKIINGISDWVYEEEFAFSKAFQWSPDGSKIAYYQFDERRVKEFSMEIYNGLYPDYYKYKYPKAGEQNSLVAIFVYDVKLGSTLRMDVGEEPNQYIPRIKWTSSSDLLSIQRMNRLQNKLEILHVDVSNGKGDIVYTENSDTYIRITDNLFYLKDGKSFIMTSEKNGFNHLYLFDMKGNQKLQITDGSWEIESIEGVDEKSKLIYYVSTEMSEMEKDFYVVDFSKNKHNKKRLSTQNGTNTVSLSPDATYYINYHSSATTPSYISIHSSAGKEIRIVEDNSELIEKMKNYQIGSKEFFKIKTKDKVSLNGWIMKPANFDATKKYPVLMYAYGGTGKQTVLNEWDGSNFFWFQMLTDMGYVVVSVDNRGTDGRGAQFRNCTYKNLGKYELLDQMDVAQQIAAYDYTDEKRIGFFGWSFGGYLASLCITVGNEIFKTAIAVAPVTSWRFYDTIYTERFLQTPQENAAGYDDNSPITHADKLKGNFLLIHGMADDNVHLQNSVEFQNALIEANKQFTSFFYPNKNHSIYGGNTRLHLYTMMTNFLKNNL